MELRHLEYFVAVAEELSFTRASRRLHVVQSGVSMAIRVLEQELGAVLFDRSRREVSLTNAGVALLREARATLDAAQAARDAVAQAHGGLRGAVSIGTMTSVGIINLPTLLGQFHAEHPGVAIRLRAAMSGSSGLARALVDRELDVAFLSVVGPHSADLVARELARVPMVLVLRADHPLAACDRVDLAGLADEPFIDSPAGWGTRAVVDRAFAVAGIERRVTLEVADIGTAANYVRQGLGVALVPDFSVAPSPGAHSSATDPDIRVLGIARGGPYWTLSVATAAARRPSAAVRALLDMVDRHVEVPGGRDAARHVPK